MTQHQSYPKVSVITVVRNGERFIENTMKSVFNQEYPNIEYIIINGNSTDATHDIVQKHIGKVDKYINEPDLGIYDAMNKGAVNATGEWIIFMNAGDTFYNDQSLTSISEQLRQSFDVIFGAAVKVLTDEIETRKFIRKPGSLKDLWKAMPSVHQATLVRTEIQKQYRFNTQYIWCADHDMLLRIYQDGSKFFLSDNIISNFDMSGGVQRDPKIFILERWNLSRDRAPSVQRFFFFAKEWFGYYVVGRVVSLIKLIIPLSLRKGLRRFLHQ